MSDLGGGGGSLGNERSHPSREFLTSSALATELERQTIDLTQRVIELAECEVAEHQARIEGYMNSPEQSHAGRERDADYHASNWHIERLRVKAQVEVARLERETTMTLLGLGLPL